MSTNTTTLAPGTFCWVDLNTTDAKAAREFYATLFGWSATEFPGPEGPYAMMMHDNRPAAGIMQHTAEMRQMSVPPHWLSYIQVEGISSHAEKVASLGGTLIKAPFNAGDHGQMSIILDPTGAVFGLWEPRDKENKAIYNQPGTLCWNELLTTDTSKAATFYTQLLNWDRNDQNFGPQPYTVFEVKGRGNAGMMTLPEEARKMGSPSNWLVYFAVADCDAAVKQATSLGATVLAPPADIPTVGRFSVLSDPQGAVFAVIRLQNQ